MGVEERDSDAGEKRSFGSGKGEGDMLSLLKVWRELERVGGGIERRDGPGSGIVSSLSSRLSCAPGLVGVASVKHVQPVELV